MSLVVILMIKIKYILKKSVHCVQADISISTAVTMCLYLRNVLLSQNNCYI